jgi:hypothetical protein
MAKSGVLSTQKGSKSLPKIELSGNHWPEGRIDDFGGMVAHYPDSLEFREVHKRISDSLL